MKTRKEFHEYDITLDEASISYQYIRDLLSEKNPDKFFPKFYKIVADEIRFPRLSKRSSVLLGLEVANHVLNHIKKSKSVTVKDSCLQFSRAPFTDKELNIVKYLSGYVFSTFYRPLKYSKVSRSILGIQSTNLLMAGKMSVDDDSATDSDVFIRVRTEVAYG